MRIVLIITMCTSLLVLAGSGSAAKPKAPKLAVVSYAPVVVKGSGFGSRERIRVLVDFQGRTTRQALRASARGAFSATFPGLQIDRCDGGVVARAIGAQGNTAVAKIGPLPQCAPRP
jgi:hypothetical protein